MEKQNDVMSVW